MFYLIISKIFQRTYFLIDVLIKIIGVRKIKGIIMKKIYFLLPALAGMMFGSSGIFVRTLTENGIDPTTLLFLRFSIAALVMFVCVLLTDKSLFKIKKEYLP